MTRLVTHRCVAHEHGIWHPSYLVASSTVSRLCCEALRRDDIDYVEAWREIISGSIHRPTDPIERLGMDRYRERCKLYRELCGMLAGYRARSFKGQP